MLHYPEHLRYTDSHEYIALDGDAATIGITAFAVDQLGDIVFVELPEVGACLQKGQPFGTVESVKAVEELYAPASGVVTAVNQDLLEHPEHLMTDPYGTAWLVKMQLHNPEDLADTMSSAEYASKVVG
jgi:glycine cleavage system H protein